MSGSAGEHQRSRVAAELGALGGTRSIEPPGLPRLRTGIPGFDEISMGGLPTRRTTLVTGTAGSGKTIFAAQFLVQGIREGGGAVFVTFEEPADDLRQNLSTLGWDVDRWEAEDRWRFVDASPVGTSDDDPIPYHFGTLLAQIGLAVDETAAERIVLDSLNVVLRRLGSVSDVRQDLRRLVVELRRLRLTAVMTLESIPDYANLTAQGFEQYVTDNVVILRNVLEDEKRRRTVEVLKMRGAMHRKGEYPFTVLNGQGVVVVPLSVIELSQHSTDTRISSGNKALDELCMGGFFRDSVVLASGATGTGKTLMVTEFIAGGAQTGDRSLLFAFEESVEQIYRNARGWGRDFKSLEEQGLLRVVATYPEVASLEDHLVEITREIEAFRPARIAIDSLSALERSGSAKGFREFIIVLTSYVKAEQIAALFTATTPTLLGGASVTDGHISTLTDSIILLRYAEVDSEVKRGLTVLKMRGSAHDKRIHEFNIDSSGMHILGSFQGVGGILAGRTVPTVALDGEAGETPEPSV
jgi:circadian clock protein KaiC